MFTIDLLKGKNVPARTQPESIAVGAVICAVPAVVALVMVSVYITMGAEIAVGQQQIVRRDAEIANLSEAVAQRKQIEKEKETIVDIQREVVSCLPQFTQWFDIVNDTAASMPDSMVLNKLQVTEVSKKKMVADKDDPKKLRESTVTVPVLHISISGVGGSNHDLAVKEFRDKLRSAVSLKGRLEDIRVAQEPDSYELFLDFKVD